MKPGAERSVHYENVRGWRSFTSIALNDIDVTIEAGSRRVLVHPYDGDPAGTLTALLLFLILCPAWIVGAWALEPLARPAPRRAR